MKATESSPDLQTFDLGHESETAISLESLNRAAARLAFLSEAGHTLTSSLNLDETFQTLAHLVIPSLADWCTITLLRAGKIHRLALAHKDPEKERYLRENADRFPPDLKASTGPPYAIRTGDHELVIDVHGREGIRFLEFYSDVPGFKEFMNTLGLSSYITVPMKLDDKRVIGAIWLARSRPEASDQFSEDDLALALDLAAIAAKAVRNAELYEQAVDKNERLKVEQDARTDFIRKQAHDIKTPLSAAVLYIDLLERKTKEQDGISSLAKNAKENINRTVQMIDYLAQYFPRNVGKKAA